MLSVKEKEEEEIMKVYRDLSEENQQLRVQILDCENQLQNHRYQNQSLEEAFQRSQSQVKSLDEDNQRLSSDLKVIELNRSQSTIYVYDLAYAGWSNDRFFAFVDAVAPRTEVV